ncbi:MAG: extracellular solute-binding protein [Chloroflexi bacterium]|nr:extracellular solute-binding protein [Chloroflexota bacterium]
MRVILMSAVIVSLVVFGGCVQGAAPQPAPAAPAAPVQQVKPKGGWESLVEAAKREATVTIYEQWGPQARVELGKAFKDKYGIDIEFVSAGTSTQLVPKLTRERRAGLYLADVIGSGGPTALSQMKPEGILAPIEPMLVLPEATDLKVWTGGKLFLDKEKLLIGMSADFGSYVARNTLLVKDGEIKSFYDLLEPKWKGKILLQDPTITGPGNAWVFTVAGLLGPDKGKDYLRQFVKQEPALVRDYRLQIEWLAKEKYAIVAGVHAPTLMEFQKLGAPVAKLRLKEGGSATAGAGALAMPAGQLPHPNAAKVFINWVLTKEGQAVFSRGYLRPSARTDVSTAGFEDSVPLPGDTVIIEDEDGILLKAQMLDVAREIFGPLVK